MVKQLLCLIGLTGLAWAGVSAPAPAEAADKTTKIVLIAGKPSHGPGDHEFNAGTKLFVKCLKEVPGVEPVFVAGGWPEDESVFQGAQSLVFFMDGGGGHPMIQKDRLETLQKLMDSGVGLVCLHYAVEVPKGNPGDHFLNWLGGYYETAYSTNPHWVAEIKTLPDHPITRGVHPFSIRDEWYFNIRFRPDMKDISPIIVAKPSDETRKGVSSSPRGPYKHIMDAAGRDEVLAWAVERPDGGRGFGFTGGHSHKNWGNPDFRTLVLNAIVWSAKLEVPSQGIKCDVTEDELSQNLDPKPQRKKNQ
jgi:type 1 glutamine amidotransferase